MEWRMASSVARKNETPAAGSVWDASALRPGLRPAERPAPAELKRACFLFRPPESKAALAGEGERQADVEVTPRTL